MCQIAPDSAYSGTYAMMKSMLPNYGIEVTFVKACDIEEYKKAIKPNTKVCTCLLGEGEVEEGKFVIGGKG